MSTERKVRRAIQAVIDAMTPAAGEWGMITDKDRGVMGDGAIAGGIPFPNIPDDIQKQRPTYAADTGSANAYAVALDPPIVSYAAGLGVAFKAANANTAASTLNVDAKGAIAIKKNGGADDLASGDIVAGQVVKIVFDGTNFQMLSAASEGGGGLQSVQVFTADGTWTKPAGINSVRVEVVGGGGGSGITSVEGGAGGGGYSAKFIDVSVISSETVTVGAGGGVNGTGGTSSFGAHNSATGGAHNAGTSGGEGGLGSGGDVNVGGGGGGMADTTAGGSGGSSVLGGGGRENQAGRPFGGGGGGTTISADGGAGAAGVVIVWEYA